MSAGINVVVVCPNLKLRNTVIRAIEVTGGITPELSSESESANRAHYAEAPSKLIINTAAERMHEILGRHCVVMALEIKDRVAAANAAQKVFTEAGYEAEVHTRAEPEFPDGFLTFVSVPALQGIALMFWPRKEDVTEEQMKTLPRREPWKA